MTRRAAQRGFTLIELMVSMTLVLVLATALGGILLDTQRNIDAVISQLALNREARGIYEMLALGGHRTGVNDAAGTVNPPAGALVDFNYVFGLRSRVPNSTATPFEGWIAPKINATTNVAELDLTNGTARTYRFALSPRGTTPDLTTFSGQVESQSPVLLDEGIINGVTVPCTGADLPLKGCSTGTTVTSSGFLQDDPVSDQLLYSGTAHYGIAFRLIDPRRLGSPTAYQNDFSSTYWFVFRSVLPPSSPPILY